MWGTSDNFVSHLDSFKSACCLPWDDVPSMKARNEIGLLFVLHDPLELKGKSGNGQYPSQVALYENITITHSLAISALSESTTS